jgi:hypothetical protein
MVIYAVPVHLLWFFHAAPGYISVSIFKPLQLDHQQPIRLPTVVHLDGSFAVPPFAGFGVQGDEFTARNAVLVVAQSIDAFERPRVDLDWGRRRIRGSFLTRLGHDSRTRY